jgi:H+-transporting ATPase
VQFVLILVVAAIPVAMPAVLSVTMAIGARTLAGMKAIVARLESIEEMAGIDVLCSDKTGTLTQNTLTLGPPVLAEATDPHEVILAGALASRAEDEDPIDRAVLAGLEGPEAAAGYVQEEFLPFDPVGKRTEAQVRDPDGRSFRVSKGAPQVILELCDPPADVVERVRRAVDETASQGMRALGVARSDDGTWQFLGVLPLFDPPRDDSADTIDQAKRHGIAVKMVTGDDTAIAAHIAADLGLGTDIQPAETFFPADASGDAVRGEDVERADGFARVFPEHKYRIVKALQARGHIVGMTGDGVNDAPALKQADTGVAVSGATDAARAAADVVLTAPGLSVVVRAVEEARRIFERMNSYAVYRITETIRIMFFVVAAMVAFDMYPITAMMIILLALLNDLPIMAIAYDRTWLDPQPVRWDMHRVLSVSTVLGLIGVLETFGLLVLARDWLGMAGPALQTFIFLKLAVAGHLTLFVARTRHAFTSRPFPAPVLVWSAVVTKLLATLLVAFGLGLVTPITWGQIGVVWAYCLVFLVIEDRVKLAVYRGLSLDHAHHRRFLATVRGHVHPFGQLHGAR